jgi:hypothetical protein
MEHDERTEWTNHYFHCGRQWDDVWDCQCNDRCPKCHAEIEPYASTDNATGEVEIHAPDIAKLAEDTELAE